MADGPESDEAAALAEQMKAATSSLRARLSLVPDLEEATTSGSEG
jgi:hypothetical protein